MSGAAHLQAAQEVRALRGYGRQCVATAFQLLQPRDGLCARVLLMRKAAAHNLRREGCPQFFSPCLQSVFLCCAALDDVVWHTDIARDALCLLRHN